MTLRAGVAGQPIAHSLSPLIHTAWIAAAGLDADYRAFGPADAAGFADLVAEGRACQLEGLNVTAPFKEQALAQADEASATARACGSANLLIFERGRVRADSTDGAGLMAALSEQAPQLEVRGRAVVVLGAGGAARAAIAALKGAGAEVGVLNRTRARAELLAQDLGAAVVEADALSDAVLGLEDVPGRHEVERAVLENGWRLESNDWSDLRERNPWASLFLGRPVLAGTADPLGLPAHQLMVR